MQPVIALYTNAVGALSSRAGEGIALLIARVALAGIFWRSGRTKVVEGTWLEMNDTTRFLFETEYGNVPLPADIAAPAAMAAEHLFPILLVVGLLTRLSAAALLVMTMVIQLFVYPEAWWSVHFIWAALAAILIARGGGMVSIDAALAGARAR